MSVQTELVCLGRDLPRYETAGLNDERFEVRSRGRCYTSQSQRRRLGLAGTGYREHLAVLVRGDLELVGDSCTGGQFVTARVRLQENGEWVLPYAARQYLDVDEGDVVYVTAAVSND
jgi:hypothetical protein